MNKGISLLVLIITIIVVIILSGTIIVSLTRNNPITTARYAVFYNDMQTLREQISLYTISTLGLYPWNSYIPSEELNSVQSLKEEIAYYRTWKLEGERPTGEIDADNMILDTPSGATDIYLVDTEKIIVPKQYEKLLYDAQTGIFYVYKGASINGKMVHSVYAASEQHDMATAIIPDFIVPPETVDNVINPGMKFDLVTNESSQIFKLYENGDVYGRGLKGSELNTTQNEMDKINISTWQEFKVPSIIPSPKKVIPGFSTIYVIDGNDELWAWGNNNYNKLGLTNEEQISYTGRNPIKLNIGGKKVKRVVGSRNNTIVITIDNLMYGAGRNNEYNLGLGHNNTINSFTKTNFDKVDKIEEVYMDMDTYEPILISCSDSTYYYTGINSHGQLGNSKTNETFTTFTQIWNSGDLDIDQDIDKILTDKASIMILKKDGTIWQAGYRGYVGGDLIGSQSAFSNYSDIFGTNVKEIYPVGTGRLLVREVGGTKEIWVSPANTNNVGIDNIVYNSTKFYKLDLPNQLLTEGIKEIITTYNNVYYISNTGNVYASGINSYLGLGSNKDKAAEVIKLTLYNIETAYNNTFLDGSSYLANTNEIIILAGKDGKLYTTGNSNLLHYNKILQNAWTKVADNVKYFTSGAYIDKNKDLWVSGSNSTVLGIGESIIREVTNYTKVNDPNINGKVEKVQKADNLISVKTTDSRLYYSGLYNINSGAPGWGDTNNRYNFVQLLSNVEENNLSFLSRFAVSNGKLYGWGRMMWDGTLGLPKAIPTEISMDSSLINNIKQITNGASNLMILTKNGELWGAGTHITTNLGMNLSNNLTKHTFNFNDEKITKILNFGGVNTVIVLTESGDLYGWGIKKYLGIGNTTDEIINSPIKLELSGVEDIIGNGTIIIAKLSNGEVWATGNNSSGVLGKWMDKNGIYSKSDYETAFEWVRCPTLEQ